MALEGVETLGVHDARRPAGHESAAVPADVDHVALGHGDLLAVGLDTAVHIFETVVEVAGGFPQQFPGQSGILAVSVAVQCGELLIAAEVVVKGHKFGAVAHAFANISCPVGKLSVAEPFLPDLIGAVAPDNNADPRVGLPHGTDEFKGVAGVFL